MFDVIGKRRWFYLFSLILTIPGLIFILLTPISDAGLQFTIDYTGGTRWEIRFQDPAVTPDQVEAVFADQGLKAVAIKAGPQFIEIKTEQLNDLQVPTPSPTPVATLPTASGLPGASASGAPSGSAGASAAASASPAPSPSSTPSSSPSGSPAPSSSPGASAAPGASPGASGAPVVSGNTKIPTEGKLGEVAAALQQKLGPIAEQRSLTTIGAVVSSDLISQALILIVVGSIG
ncbi:MAG: hypothetical protein ABJC39_09420, partial [Chloroflexota bacterium]